MAPGGISGKESACQRGRRWRQVFDPAGLEDPLEKEMAIHFSILALNPIDRGIWQAAVHGLAKSQTQISEHVHTHRHTPIKFFKNRKQYF